MAKQLLIYEKVVPVSKERHLNWSLKAGEDYLFTRTINSLPLTGGEFPQAAAEYPIIFTGSQESGVFMPALVLGLRSNENMYLSESGQWNANYIPAFVRRYPFVFSGNGDGTTLTLCLDEDCSGFNQEGRGERLFDADGNQTQYLNKVLEFLKGYQAQYQRTLVFCKRLAELEILEPMQATLKSQTGEKTSLEGFWVVSRDKLKALPGEKIVELMTLDELELIYLHLQSLRNFSSLAERAARKQPSGVAAS